MKLSSKYLLVPSRLNLLLIATDPKSFFRRHDMSSVDLVVVVGQSNAKQAVTAQLGSEYIGGSFWSGNLLSLACVEASYKLYGNPSQVIGVALAGDPAQGQAPADATIFSGTPLIHDPSTDVPPYPTNPVYDWFNYTNGYSNVGIRSDVLEANMNTYLQSVSSYLTQSGYSIGHVMILDMHNESDQYNYALRTNAGITNWQDATFWQQDDISYDLGNSNPVQSPDPLAFAWTPSNNVLAGTGATSYQDSGNNDGLQSGGNQIGYINPDGSVVGYLDKISHQNFALENYNVHAAEEALVDNPADRISWLGNFGDAAVSGSGIPNVTNGSDNFNSDGSLKTPVPNDRQTYGGLHYSTTMNSNDFQYASNSADFVTRWSGGITNTLGQTSGNGDISDKGPSAISYLGQAQPYATVIDQSHTLVTVKFQLDQNQGINPNFSAAALAGAGWTTGNGLTVSAYATAASMISSDTIELIFNQAVSLSDKLFYEGVGDGQVARIDYPDHFADPANNPGFTKFDGEGSAIYDNMGMPIQVSAFGLPIELPGQTPSIPTQSTVAGSSIPRSVSEVQASVPLVARSGQGPAGKQAASLPHTEPMKPTPGSFLSGSLPSPTVEATLSDSKLPTQPTGSRDVDGTLARNGSANAPKHPADGWSLLSRMGHDVLVPASSGNSSLVGRLGVLTLGAETGAAQRPWSGQTIADSSVRPGTILPRSPTKPGGPGGVVPDAHVQQIVSPSRTDFGWKPPAKIDQKSVSSRLAALPGGEAAALNILVPDTRTHSFVQLGSSRTVV